MVGLQVVEGLARAPEGGDPAIAGVEGLHPSRDGHVRDALVALAVGPHEPDVDDHARGDEEQDHEKDHEDERRSTLVTQAAAEEAQEHESATVAPGAVPS